MLFLQMVMKLVGVMGTAQKKSMFIGRAGPCVHWRLPVAKKSLEYGTHPPRKNTPISLRTATAPVYLCVVRFPILLSSQRWLIGSSTRQEVVRLPRMNPPQVATRGVGSDVMNVSWPYLQEGSGGGEQLLVFGKTSVVDVAGCPPVMSRTLSCSWEVEEVSNGTPGF